ncbi:MAG: hypothetical protein ACE5IO_06925 [Thermoplasmata archaeon]
MKTKYYWTWDSSVLGIVWIIAVIVAVAMLAGSAAQSVWVQTTQVDFNNATAKLDVDTSSSPGNVTLVQSPTDWTKAQGNPVLDLGTTGSWDDFLVYHPFVLPPGDPPGESDFRMWYMGEDGGSGSRIGFAQSRDGYI